MSLRIKGEVLRGAQVTIYLDGVPTLVFEGESVAAALLANGERVLRQSPRMFMPRGMFCHMGACQECLVEVDGLRALACQTPVREGMAINRQTPE